MRGANDTQCWMFSYFSPEQRIPAQHPLQAIKVHADTVRAELSSYTSLLTRNATFC